MDGKTIARIGAVVFVGVAITVTIVELTRDEPEPPLYRTLATPAQLPVDPLRVALRQCRDMGEAAIRDAGCRRVWIEARDRFLGRRGASPDKTDDAPTTLFPTIPAPANGAAPSPTTPEPSAGASVPSANGGR